MVRASCWILALSCLAASIGYADQAGATQVFRTFDLNASDFTLEQGGPALPPVDPLHLNFTIDFDNSVDHTNDTSGLTINSSTFIQPFVFGYSQSLDELTVSFLAGPNSCTVGLNQACFGIGNVSSANPFLQVVAQFQAGIGNNFAGLYEAQTRSLTFSEGAAVPEPATWAMMLIGLGSVGFAMRKSRQKIEASYSFA
jgi:hypothetical protein